jgi:hypothetical protein
MGDGKAYYTPAGKIPAFLRQKGLKGLGEKKPEKKYPD